MITLIKNKYMTLDRIKEEIEIALKGLETKLNKETNLGVFSKEEQLIIKQAYLEITSKVFCSGCSGAFNMVRKILVNYLNKLNEVEIVEPLEIERVDEVKPKRKPRKRRAKKK